MQRTPRGYVGIGHETIGSDILAVLRTLKLPEQVLSAEEIERLRHVDAQAWYPIAWLLELMDTLDKRVGHFGLLSLGRTLFKMSHEERVREVAKSASDILFNLDDMYRHANRGAKIGGWTVKSFAPGRAELEKNTPHHCVMEQGLLLEALSLVGAPSLITQPQCFRAGADVCRYVITSAITDNRFMGGRDELK
jgi:hypothetical protein